MFHNTVNPTSRVLERMKKAEDRKCGRIEEVVILSLYVIDRSTPIHRSAYDSFEAAHREGQERLNGGAYSAGAVTGEKLSPDIVMFNLLAPPVSLDFPSNSVNVHDSREITIYCK